MVTGVGSSASPTVEASRAASNDARRSNKPIMEKRRRARINNCLNELKTLILEAMKKDPARHSKLEKADILEMTVRHLESLQRQRAAADPAVLNKFRAGFTQCVGEVGRFPGLDPVVRRRLLQHLASCLSSPVVHTQSQQPQSPPQAANIYLTTGGGLQLVPTRLPNGDIALVLPAQAPAVAATSSPLPTLIPIPARTASAASESSTATTSSASMEMIHDTSDVPLSLVTRRPPSEVQCKEEAPWRPW